MLKTVDGTATQWCLGSEAVSLSVVLPDLFMAVWYTCHHILTGSVQPRRQKEFPRRYQQILLIGAPGQTPGTYLHLTRIREETGCTNYASFPRAGGKSPPSLSTLHPHIWRKWGVGLLEQRRSGCWIIIANSDNCFFLSASYVPSTVPETWRGGIPHNVPPRWWFRQEVMSHFCDPVDWSSWGFSVQGIFQARILE